MTFSTEHVQFLISDVYNSNSKKVVTSCNVTDVDIDTLDVRVDTANECDRRTDTLTDEICHSVQFLFALSMKGTARAVLHCYLTSLTNLQ